MKNSLPDQSIRHRRPTAVSLFSGCGGSDAGVLEAGFEVVMANDVIPYARDVYLSSHPETDYILGDVRKIASFPKADLLVGCYPCQGFSQGGVRDPSRSINYLYLEFRRALADIKPKAFVVENVSGMVRQNYKHLLEDQLRVFRLCGYRVKHQVLNAADYGVPQDRKRIFLVGIRSDIKEDYSFPKPTHGDGCALPFASIRQALDGMPLWPTGEYYDRAFHWYYLSRDRRRDWDSTSKTIVSNPRHMPLHPVSPRLLKREHNVWEFESDAPARRFSYREAARLQGFGDLLSFPDSEIASLDMRYKVVGNAVPPPLFRAVVRSLPDIWG
ncbi:DNA (cytosine-5-)-methyltransferase [Achromobacter xylosoxidans]|uniref:DNA cytosine methyltransferase n=1 Tax=Alcaligenes xylosoxydans xylosoxydans TaxID=85698 RepID=UPI0015CA4A77|nr:DNA (cytosine-5-)-methyltransferase [Achromobacter xylosoxidans]NYS16424.1 DNA (cytosine-5-)-methyltransferase [Achromobacter xylosoxidans]